MKEKRLKHYVKGARYLVQTDKVIYWRKNFKEVFNLTCILTDEKIDYVVCYIHDKKVF